MGGLGTGLVKDAENARLDALEKVNQIRQAIEKWEAALALVRSLPGPASKLQVHKVEKELRALIRAGNSAVGSGDYAIAISRFKEALELAKTRAQKKELEKKIDDSGVRQDVMHGVESKILIAMWPTVAGFQESIKSFCFSFSVDCFIQGKRR